MPRQARIDFPGALQHVIGRGIERRDIFKKDKDKQEFYSRLKLLLSKCKIQCYAWCIMDNHFHLLLITGATPLSEFMRRLLTGYAIYYNKKYKRAGHLFQNRYKSIICDRDEYLLPLVRYIHLNPTRIKKTNLEGLSRYRWAGHREVMNKQREGIIEREDVLSFFGDKESRALRAYFDYVKEGVGLKEDYRGGGLIRSAGGLREAMSRKKDEREMYDERMLGDGGFVEDVYRMMGKEDERKGKIRDIEELLEKVSSYYKVDKEGLLHSRKGEVRNGRSVAIYLGNNYLGEKISSLGKLFGITQPAASIAMRRGKEIYLKEGMEEKIFN